MFRVTLLSHFTRGVHLLLILVTCVYFLCFFINVTFDQGQKNYYISKKSYHFKILDFNQKDHLKNQMNKLIKLDKFKSQILLYNVYCNFILNLNF
jgi:hypothetical protein